MIELKCPSPSTVSPAGVGLAVIALLMGCSTVVFGQDELDGNALLSHCQAAVRLSDDAAKQTPATVLGGIGCMAYLQGLTQGNAVAQRGFAFCLPEGARSGEQLARIMVKHLNENPEDLHLPAGILTTRALMKAYPCEKKGR